MVEQNIYLLKRAITISPSIWRENLLLKLRKTYLKENRMEALNDLDQLMGNKKKMEDVLAENILPAKQKEKAPDA